MFKKYNAQHKWFNPIKSCGVTPLGVIGMLAAKLVQVPYKVLARPCRALLTECFFFKEQ